MTRKGDECSDFIAMISTTNAPVRWPCCNRFMLMLIFFIPCLNFNGVAGYGNITSNWLEREKYAIQDVYYATNGAQWNTKWNITLVDQCINDSGCNVCELDLHGIGCSNTTHRQRIIYIDLQENGLKGTISASVGNLDKLSGLGLSHNELEGAMPDSIGNLVQLESLTLHDNKLDGLIPESIGNLTRLKWLIVHNNNLKSNDIVKSLFNKVKRLSIISISNNPSIKGDLSKWEWKDSTNLTMTFLAFNCDLYGSLAKQIKLKDIGYFFIHNNRLSCTLPSNLFPQNQINSTKYTILPSNMFEKSGSHFPSWMKSSLFDMVDAFYIDEMDKIVSIAAVSFCTLIVMIGIVVKIVLLINKTKNNDKNKVKLEMIMNGTSREEMVSHQTQWQKSYFSIAFYQLSNILHS